MITTTAHQKRNYSTKCEIELTRETIQITPINRTACGIPESFSTFWSIVSLTVAKRLVQSAAWVKLMKATRSVSIAATMKDQEDYILQVNIA
jgi:uncharacterized membrane protein